MEQSQNIAKLLEDLKKASGLSLQLADTEDGIPENAEEKLSQLAAAWREKYDRNSFLRNLLCGTYSGADLYTAAARFHIPEHRRRVLFVIELKSGNSEDAVRVLRQMFVLRSGDQFFILDEKRIVLMKSISDKETEDSLVSEAHTMVDMLSMEAMISARVGISQPAEVLGDLPEAFQNAVLSLRIGNMFYSSEPVLLYSRLGIGRLIHDLPEASCRMFMREVFGDISPDDFDEETTSIINAFFENNLNISETARQLYVHRNTLVYRLEKLHQLTGLDLRVFDEAMALKLAMMIAERIK